MQRHFGHLLTLCMLLSAGCSMQSQHRIEPERVTFDHEDEVITSGRYMVLADRRIFAVMAFANASGYDEEYPGYSMHPVRLKVREELQKRLADKPEKLEVYRNYYRRFMVPSRGFGYKNHVLSFSSDYPFRQIRPDEELGYPFTVTALRDLPEMLNDFWETTDLGSLWEQVKPDYIAEIKKYNLEKMDRQMSFLWDYLRMQRTDDPSIVVVHIPDLLNRYLGAMGAGYETYYYNVENPGAGGYDLNIHEYLHSVVNPLVITAYPQFQTKLDAYYTAGKGRPAIETYREPTTFAFECMVVALDRRISAKFENNPAWTELKERQIAHDTTGGFTLVQPFYDLLIEYEQSNEPFDRYLPTLLEHLPEYKQ